MSTPKKWSGDLLFVVENLLLKDFRIRYRNMSLGILWSLINPLVMMGVLSFVFGRVFGNPNQPTFPLFVLCGLVPFNFFSSAFLSGTNSIVDSAHLIKRVPVPREVVPVAAVLSNCIHLVIQMGLLAVFAFAFRLFPTANWLWLPVIWLLFVVFVCGLALGTSAINVFIRDTRYLVESCNLVLFWLVPVFYSFTIIPAKYVVIYRFNPVAALVMATRNILIDRQPPPMTLIVNMTIAATVSLALGILIFSRLKARFYEHL
jgi:homopolymeric O-antigen transport system permease protein